MTRNKSIFATFGFHISEFLALVPSIYFATIYLVLIPLFAIIYDCIPAGFFEQHIVHEYSLIDDYRVILTIFEDALRNKIPTFTKIDDATSIIVLPPRCNTNFLSLEDFAVRQSNNFAIRCDLDAVYYTPKNTQFPVLRIDTVALMKFGQARRANIYNGDLIINLKVGNLNLSSTDVTIYVSDELSKEEVQIILQTLFGNIQSENDYWRTTFKISDTLIDAIQKFDNGRRGMSFYVSQNYLRMLYVSAITITTLGYGDIVPISDLARFLVSAEAILGVVVIGLFLNALAYQSRPSAWRNDQGET